MSNKKLLRNLGLAAAAVFAIGLAGYLAKDGSGSSDDAAMFTNGGSAGSVAPSVGMTSDGFFGGDKDAIALEERQSFSDSAEAPMRGESGVASAPAADGGPMPAGGSLASSVDRQIVSSASIQLQVSDVGGGFEEVGRIATTAGGFIASSSFSYRGEDQIASVTIRVPSESYQSVLGSLRRLGVKVDAENSNAQDVTEEYTDLGSRLRTLEATETQLLTLLGRAETISDILTVQDRLNYTRMEIEQVKGRQQLLDNLTSLATITVHLQPVVAGNGSEPGTGVDLGAEVTKAWDNSIEFLTEIAAGVVTVVVFAWWVPVIGLPLLGAYKAMTRNRPQPVD